LAGAGTRLLGSATNVLMHLGESYSETSLALSLKMKEGVLK